MAHTDKDGNEITPIEKLFAGFMLIFLISFSAIYIIGHWPDQVPGPKDDIQSLYKYDWFHVELAYVPAVLPSEKTGIGNEATNTVAKETSNETATDTIAADSAAVTVTINTNTTHTNALTKAKEPVKCANKAHYTKQHKLMHLNTILLILVAFAGFLGNMIHIATSFTTFIGAGKFKRSWTLWYCIKPFTAAALAICFYFVFRAGFLNMSNDSANINIYGLVTISILTGLFTDKATVKLKEVFDVLMRPKEELPDALVTKKAKIEGVKARLSEDGTTLNVTISGKDLSAGKVDITIEGLPITTFTATAESITFLYTIPDTLKDKEEATILIKFEKDAMPQEFKLKIKSEAPQPANTEPAADNQPTQANTNTVDIITNAADIVPGGPDVENDDENIVNE